MDILSYVMGVQAGKASGGSDIELIENLPVPVDFSQGNQFIEAPEGQAVKSAIIQKPENLVAENIAEGVDIAGIIGTLASGGGGGNIVTASKFVYPTNGQSFTFEHGLGVIPDIVFCYSSSDTVLGAKQTFLMAWGCSTAYSAKGLKFPKNEALYMGDTILSVNTGSANCIDESNGKFFRNANETSITVVSPWTNRNWCVGQYIGYSFYFIGGLT